MTSSSAMWNDLEYFKLQADRVFARQGLQDSTHHLSSFSCVNAEDRRPSCTREPFEKSLKDVGLLFSTTRQVFEYIESGPVNVPSSPSSLRSFQTPKPSDRESAIYREYEMMKLVSRTVVPDSSSAYHRNQCGFDAAIDTGTFFASDAEELNAIVADLVLRDTDGVYLRSVYEYQILFQHIASVLRSSEVKYKNGEQWIRIVTTNPKINVFVLATQFQQVYSHALRIDPTTTTTPPDHCSVCQELCFWEQLYAQEYSRWNPSGKKDSSIQFNTTRSSPRAFPPLVTPCGCILLVENRDCKGALEPMRVLPKLPLVITSTIGSGDIERMLRLEKGIKRRDIYDRQCHKKVMSRSTVRRHHATARNKTRHPLL